MSRRHGAFWSARLPAYGSEKEACYCSLVSHYACCAVVLYILSHDVCTMVKLQDVTCHCKHLHLGDRLPKMVCIACFEDRRLPSTLPPIQIPLFLFVLFQILPATSSWPCSNVFQDHQRWCPGVPSDWPCPRTPTRNTRVYLAWTCLIPPSLIWRLIIANISQHVAFAPYSPVMEIAKIYVASEQRLLLQATF